MSSAATASLGRCQPADSVAIPTTAATSAPSMPPAPRIPAGSTSSSATVTDAAVVVCPLGRLLPAAARGRSMPSCGRSMTSLSSCVVRFAPTMSSITPNATATRRRINAMKPMTAVAMTKDSTDTVFNTVSTGFSTRVCPMRLPASATVSNCCPCADRTKNHQTATKPATSTPASRSNHRTRPIGRPRMRSNLADGPATYPWRWPHRTGRTLGRRRELPWTAGGPSARRSVREPSGPSMVRARRGIGSKEGKVRGG